MLPSNITPINFRGAIKVVDDVLKAVNRDEAFVNLFRKNLSQDNIILTNSGSTSLRLLLKAYSIGRGDEVALPAYGCETLANVLRSMNVKILFIDVNEGDVNISVDDLREKITRRTKAIIPIHMFGIPCEIGVINEIADEYGIPVIEDSCQALFSKYHGKFVGTIAESSFFSFNFGKSITMCGGGLVVTKNAEIAKKCKVLIEDFKIPTFLQKIKKLVEIYLYFLMQNERVYSSIYDVINNYRLSRRNKLQTTHKYTDFIVNNYHFNTIIGLYSYCDFVNTLRIRKRVGLTYESQFKKIKEISSPRIINNTSPVFSRYPIYIKDGNPALLEKIQAKLAASGIDITNPYPKPLPNFLGYSECPPNSNDLANKLFVLPITNLHSRDSVEKIVENVVKYT